VPAARLIPAGCLMHGVCIRRTTAGPRPFFPVSHRPTQAGCAEPHALLSNHPRESFRKGCPCRTLLPSSPPNSPSAHAQVQAAIDLLDGGATFPFIARYRKEATGMLDDIQLRALEERLRYLREDG